MPSSGGLSSSPRSGEVLQRIGVRGTISLGYIRLDFDDPGMSDGSGITGNADVSFEFLKKTTGQLSFSRGFQFSIYSGASFYLTTRYGAGIARHLSRRATLSYDFSYTTHDYPGDTSFADVNNRYLSHGLRLELKLARYLDLTVFGSLSQRTQYAAAPVQNRNFVGFNLVYGFGGTGMSAPVGGLQR